MILFKKISLASDKEISGYFKVDKYLYNITGFVYCKRIDFIIACRNPDLDISTFCGYDPVTEMFYDSSFNNILNIKKIKDPALLTLFKNTKLLNETLKKAEDYFIIENIVK